MKILRFRATAQVSWRVSSSSDDSWVAVCDALKLTAMGDTWQELQETIADIQQDLMLDLLRSGELPKFLRDMGWELRGDIPAVTPDAEPAVQFDLPWRTEANAAPQLVA